MPITGSQTALMYSLSGVLRCGAGRSGYFPALCVLSIGGVDVTSRGKKTTATIIDEIDATPNTATLTVRGSSTFTPAKGQEILIGLGNQTNRIFAGHIQNVTRRQYVKDIKAPDFDLDCIDYTWQLDWKRVQGKNWSSTSVGTIVTDIITTFASAFTLRLEAGMPSIDFQSNQDEKVSECLSRLMKIVGGYWYVDYDRKVHAFINPETDANLTTIDSSYKNFWDFQYIEDITQTRTRTRVTGGASSTTSVVAVGSTTIPVDDTTLFGSSGGYALIGANQITYTGKSVTTGPGNLTGVPASSTGSVLVTIQQGESVRVLAIADDATAAAAIATLVGTGDGYLEYSLADGTLGDAAARTAAAGDISLNKDPDMRLSYMTTDLFAKSGKIITVDLTNSRTSQHITGTYQIQRVVMTDLEISQKRYPHRRVEAGKNNQNIFTIIGGIIESN
jgi:hypothetical protein